MRSYTPNDYAEISSWCRERGRLAPPEWALPKTGLISDGVACGFLIRMENQLGLLEFYISNESADEKIRSAALDEITQGLISAAKEHGLKMILANSNIPSIQKRALRNGMTESGTYRHFTRSL